MARGSSLYMSLFLLIKSHTTAAHQLVRRGDFSVPGGLERVRMGLCGNGTGQRVHGIPISPADCNLRASHGTSGGSKTLCRPTAGVPVSSGKAPDVPGCTAQLSATTLNSAEP